MWDGKQGSPTGEAKARKRQSKDAGGTPALGAPKASGTGPVGLCRRRTGRSTVCLHLQNGDTPEEWAVRSPNAQPAVLRVGGTCGCERCAGTHNRRFAPARRGNCLRAFSGAACSLNDEERAGRCCDLAQAVTVFLTLAGWKHPGGMDGAQLQYPTGGSAGWRGMWMRTLSGTHNRRFAPARGSIRAQSCRSRCAGLRHRRAAW